MHFIAPKRKSFSFDLKDNRLAILADQVNDKPNKKSLWANITSLPILDNTPVKVWHKDMDFPVLVTKHIFKNEDKEKTGVAFLVSKDLNLTDSNFGILCKKRWSVEEYHKSLNQNASIAKSPTRTMTTQTSHLYYSILAYVKLKKIKAKIYIKALKTAYAELKNIKEQALPA